MNYIKNKIFFLLITYSCLLFSSKHDFKFGVNPNVYDQNFQSLINHSKDINFFRTK